MKAIRPLNKLLAGAALAAQLLFPSSEARAAVTNVCTYFAGSNGIPATAPDPTSPAGGNWVLSSLGVGVSNYATTIIYTNLNPDPLFTNLNCWRTLDNTNIAGGTYTFSPSGDQITNCAWNGFTLSAYYRFQDISPTYNGGITVYLRYADTNFNIQFATYIDINAAGNLYLEPQALAGNITNIAASGPGVTNYHLVQIVYDPPTRTANYLVDGVVLRSNVTTTAAGGTGPTFGTASSSGKGDGYWNFVKLDAQTYSAPVITLNPTNATRRVTDSYTFKAAFTGSATALQWFKDGNPIAGGTNRTLTLNPVASTDSGTYQFAAFDPLAGAYVYSSNAVFTVTADFIPPTVVAIQPVLTMQHVLVQFSEIPEANSALNIANYSFVGSGLSVISAQFADISTIRLRVSPLTANTSYTLHVANIQDPSANVLVATNVTFLSANLTPVCVYDAGSNSVVAAAPDPSSAAGGRWKFFTSGDPTLNTYGSVPADAIGLNGWNITDQQNNGGRVEYFFNFPAQSHAFAKTNGWRLHSRARFVDDFDSVQTIFLQYCDPNGSRFGSFFDLGGINVDLYAILNAGSLAISQTNLTSGGNGATSYHDYDIVFNTNTLKADFYFDGNFQYGPWAGDVSSGFNGPWFGSISDPGEGSMNFNQVDYSVVNAVHPTITTNPVSVATNLNATVTFTASTAGFVGGYNWYKNGVITGVTGPTYTTTATAANEGSYVMGVFDSTGEAQSAPATLTVLPTLSITNDSGNVTVTFTGVLQQSATATGTFTNVVPAPASPLIISNSPGTSLFFRAAHN